MTTIILDDNFANEITACSESGNAQEAVVKILADYLQQKKARQSIIDLLAMPDSADIDFEIPPLTQLYQAADLT